MVGRDRCSFHGRMEASENYISSTLGSIWCLVVTGALGILEQIPKGKESVRKGGEDGDSPSVWGWIK